MRKTRFTRQEKKIEEALMKGEYLDVDKKDYDEIAHAIAARRKDAILHIRVNSQDLSNIKKLAKRLGVKYQSFVSEVLHRVAH